MSIPCADCERYAAHVPAGAVVDAIARLGAGSPVASAERTA